jgi:hypothetical protein
MKKHIKPFTLIRPYQEGEMFGDRSIVNDLGLKLWWAVPLGEAGPGDVGVC